VLGIKAPLYESTEQRQSLVQRVPVAWCYTRQEGRVLKLSMGLHGKPAAVGNCTFLKGLLGLENWFLPFLLWRNQTLKEAESCGHS